MIRNTFYFHRIYGIIASIIIACVLANIKPTHAQEPTDDASGIKKTEEAVKHDKIKTTAEIVITATKTGINKQETGSSITLITAEEIEQKGKRALVDILREVPGIAVSASAGMGGQTDLYIRGTESHHTVVLIDGVRVNDPTSPANGFDFGHLTVENIDRVEIVRGALSALYGSDAIGGVINIITKKGSGDPRVTVLAEGGTYRTFRELIGASGGTKTIDYSFALSRIDSAGYNKTSTYKGMSRSLSKDRDGYVNTSASGRMGVKTIRDSWLNFSFKYIDSKTGIDDGAFDDDINHIYESDALALNLAYGIPVFKWWQLDLSYNYMNQTRKDRDTMDLYDYDPNWGTVDNLYFWWQGKRNRGEIKNIFKIGEIDEITIGAEYEKEYSKNMPYYDYTTATDIIDKTRTSWAAYAQNHLKLFKRVFIISGLRYTDPEDFNPELCYSLSGSLILPYTETRFKGNLGTGYKIPSLYQLYSYYWRTNLTFLYLKPELTRSWDAGIEQPLFKNRAALELNYYSTDYNRMIYYDNYSYRYYTIRAQSRGIEVIASIKPIDGLKIDASYTYNKTNNRTYHSGEMLRRPVHKGSLNIAYVFLKDKATLNAGASIVGKRRDYSIYPYYSYLSTYYTLDMAASFQAADWLQVFGRMENIMDAKYEDVRGYRMPGRFFSVGIKATL